MIYLLKILNSSLNTVKIFTDFISIIWTTQYYGQGEFELVVEYTKENWAALQNDYYIVKNNSNEVGIIEKVDYSFSSSDGGTITATGRMGISILERRLLYSYNSATHRPNQWVYCLPGQNVEAAAQIAVNSTLVNPTNSERDYPELHLGTSHGYSATANRRVSLHQNLYTTLTAFLASKLLAHRIVYSGTGLEYDVYKGTDRSATMIFSRNLGNLISFNYEKDSSEYKNFIYIGGDGEGLDRFATVMDVNVYQSGKNRREYFYEASTNRAEGETDTEYNINLLNEAGQECREYFTKSTVQAEIDLVNSGYEFGVDYFVGDIILIKDIVNFKPRITTVIESQTADGYAIDVEFNEDAPEEEEE